MGAVSYAHSLCSVETAALKATCTGPRLRSHRPGKPKFRILSRHHSQDRPAAYSSSNVTIKNIIILYDKKHGECLYRLITIL